MMGARGGLEQGKEGLLVIVIVGFSGVLFSGKFKLELRSVRAAMAFFSFLGWNTTELLSRRQAKQH